MSQDRLRLWGRDEQPEPLPMLTAGALRAKLDGPDLRWISLNDTELARRIYVAVRDPNWGTVKPTSVRTEVERHADSVTVRIQAVHREGPIWFEWTGISTIHASGPVRYEITGEHRNDYEYARIGLNIHHTPAVTAGASYRATGPHGETTGILPLPLTIGPQRVSEGSVVPLFPPMSDMETVCRKAHLAFGFEGSLFEMEDQRNWTDNSFKTYGSPQTPGTQRARRGERLHQSIELRVLGSTARRVPEQGPTNIRITVGPRTGTKVPSVGLSMNSEGHAPTPDQVDLLRMLGPCHLRASIHPASPNSDLQATSRLSGALDCSLEPAIAMKSSGDLTRTDFSGKLSVLTPEDRVLVTQTTPEVVDQTAVDEVRKAAGSPAGTLFVGGTNGHFVDLNRDPQEAPSLDAVVYPICPQIHASDEASLMEGLEAQRATVATAQERISDTVVISPITLAPRRLPNSPPDFAVQGRDLPNSVDRRQPTQFLAAWTVGSLKYLSETGVEAATYFETVGWRGVMDREDTTHPDFPSRPGLVYPVYHVLADICSRRGLDVLTCSSSDPLGVIGLAIQDGTGVSVLIANLTPFHQSVTVGPLPTPSDLRVLDVDTPEALEPSTAERYRSQLTPIEPGQELELRPYAVASISPRDRTGQKGAAMRGTATK